MTAAANPRDVTRAIDILTGSRPGALDGREYAILSRARYDVAMQILRDVDARTGRRDPTVRTRQKVKRAAKKKRAGTRSRQPGETGGEG